MTFEQDVGGSRKVKVDLIVTRRDLLLKREKNSDFFTANYDNSGE